MEERHLIDKEYPNYGGLDREALFFNVPIVVFALLALATALPAMLLFQFGSAAYGLIVIVVGISVFAYLSFLCSQDDQAMRITAIELWVLLRRKNAKIFGGTTTVLSTRYGRHRNDYRRLLEQYSETTTSRFGFSTKDLPTLDARNSELY